MTNKNNKKVTLKDLKILNKKRNLKKKKRNLKIRKKKFNQTIKRMIRIVSISYLILSLGIATEFRNKVVLIVKQFIKK